MLFRMFDKRCKGYESLGYGVLLPARAMQGWPAELPLPEHQFCEILESE
jgi:hypothetical protein